MNQASVTDHVGVLNATIGKIYYSMATLLDASVEIGIELMSGTTPEGQPQIKIWHDQIAQLRGPCVFRTTGDLTILKHRKDGHCNDFVIRVHVLMVLRPELQQYFDKWISQDLLETTSHKIGFYVVFAGHCHDGFSDCLWLHSETRKLELDALSETLLRANASALVCDLQPYIEWCDYVEDLSLDVVEENRRDQLIQDFTLILRYISSGNHLNFSAMTSLCDVAGSLKPVRSLILKHMPKLLND